MDLKDLYLCDPEKNVSCKKHSVCGLGGNGGECVHTKHKEFAKDGCTDMPVSRAITILNPGHRENYDGIDVVKEACTMGMNALYRLIGQSPYPDGDRSILACPRCGSGEYLHNSDGAQNSFCGQCGQAIDWKDAAETDA